MADPAQALTPRTDTNPKIEINPDGTYTPVGGVSIPKNGKVVFDVDYPADANVCTITFSSITFSYEPDRPETGVGTVKVGSGN
jgi:hypothetical protein